MGGTLHRILPLYMDGWSIHSRDVFCDVLSFLIGISSKNYMDWNMCVVGICSVYVGNAHMIRVNYTVYLHLLVK